MNNKPILIVMLTHNDKTVANARSIFEQCKNSKAEYWGFKEAPLPLDEMKELFSYMNACGKKTVLEVVAYEASECMKGAKMAVECGCDILMGTIYSDAINNLCKQHNIKYMPFVGDIIERPSILRGSINDMISEANRYSDKDVYGIDLLGYRYTGDASELNRQLVSNVNKPVCVAGSINSFERLDEIKAISPWAFTIGSAFFENAFGDDFCSQINIVCDYLDN